MASTAATPMQATVTCRHVGPALAVYAGVSHKDAQTLRSIIKRVFPDAGEMSPPQFQEFLNSLPLAALKQKLAADGSGWAADTKEEILERCPRTDTYLKSYPRFLRRFLDFAGKAGMIESEETPLMPEWEAYVSKAFSLIPQDKDDIRRWTEAGVKEILGRYPLRRETQEATNTKVQNIRSATRRLARAASQRQMSPHDFAEAFLDGQHRAGVEGLAGKGVYYTYARALWNATGRSFPALDLPEWPDRRRQIGIPLEQWPEPLRVGLAEAIFERPLMQPLEPQSIKNYQDKLCGMVGILVQQGIDMERLVGGLTPNEAVRLLFQGWPHRLLEGDSQYDAPHAIYRRLISDPDFKEAVLREMKGQDYKDGEPQLVESPFVRLILQERYTEGKYASAEGMLDRVWAINAEYLHIRAANLSWLQARKEQVDRHLAEQETCYDEKKAIVFKNPRLFEALIERACELHLRLDEMFSRQDARRYTFIRDLTYFALTTLFPLRVENFATMKLGENYDPASHTITFRPRDVKNKKAIDFQLPSQGRLDWVRSLVNEYLDIARPQLLAGNDSAYFFVGNRRIPNANGYLRRQTFNEILCNFSERHLADVLPAELGNLNPHLFRHVTATYQIVVCKDPERAAQLLNDSLKTIHQHYADILGSSRQNCKAFYDGFKPH